MLFNHLFVLHLIYQFYIAHININVEHSKLISTSHMFKGFAILSCLQVESLFADGICRTGKLSINGSVEHTNYWLRFETFFENLWPTFDRTGIGR